MEPTESAIALTTAGKKRFGGVELWDQGGLIQILKLPRVVCTTTRFRLACCEVASFSKLLGIDQKKSKLSPTKPIRSARQHLQQSLQ
jgi:hypothetical protein